MIGRYYFLPCKTWMIDVENLFSLGSSKTEVQLWYKLWTGSWFFEEKPWFFSSPFSYRKYVFSLALNFCIQNVLTIFVLRISKLVDFSNRHRNKTTSIRAGKNVMRILMAINNNFCWWLWQSLNTHCIWNCFLPFRGHPYMTSNFGLMDILIYQYLKSGE